MSEQGELFSAEAYGATRRRGPRPPSLMRTVQAGAEWSLLVLAVDIDEHAHRFTNERTGEGASVTRCGRYGRRVEIPATLSVRPCEACEVAP